jgi:hypothetical protein
VTDTLTPWVHRVGGEKVESDILERAEAAWNAGNEELQRVIKLPRPKPESVPDGLKVGEQALQRADLDPPTERLAMTLGVLRDFITAAKGASVGPGLAESNVVTRLEQVNAQTHRLRALREKYEARWGPAAKGPGVADTLPIAVAVAARTPCA